MISHLVNALIYQTGLFKGFYSTINLGDANIATEEGDLLIMEEQVDGVSEQLITENGIANGSIQGVYGYQYQFFPEPNYTIDFVSTGQVYDPKARGNRGEFVDIDCGPNDCPVNPITEINVSYNGVHPNNYSLQTDPQPIRHKLSSLDSTDPNNFKYWWILRYVSFDYVSFVPEEVYKRAFLEISPDEGYLLGGSQYTGTTGGIYIYNNEMRINDGYMTKIGEFREV